MAIFAGESGNLRTTIHLLPGVLKTANRGARPASTPRSRRPRAFAREILPGVRETPATIDAAFPWIAQARPLLRPGELGGLVQRPAPGDADLATVTDETIKLLPQADLMSRCVTKVILPTGDIVIQDGALTTGEENYKEFWYTMVGLAGEGQNFDGNGLYVRFQPGGGDQTVSTGAYGGAVGDPDNAAGRVQSLQPGRQADRHAARLPGRCAAVPPNRPCYKNKIPDLNGRPRRVGARRTRGAGFRRRAARVGRPASPSA